MGNHDEFLLDAELVHTYSAAPQVVASINWTRCRLSRAELDFLRSFGAVLRNYAGDIDGAALPWFAALAHRRYPGIHAAGGA
jgi:hypothetical protein